MSLLANDTGLYGPDLLLLASYGPRKADVIEASPSEAEFWSVYRHDAVNGEAFHVADTRTETDARTVAGLAATVESQFQYYSSQALAERFSIRPPETIVREDDLFISFFMKEEVQDNFKRYRWLKEESTLPTSVSFPGWRLLFHSANRSRGILEPRMEIWRGQTLLGGTVGAMSQQLHKLLNLERSEKRSYGLLETNYRTEIQPTYRIVQCDRDWFENRTGIAHQHVVVNGKEDLYLNSSNGADVKEIMTFLTSALNHGMPITEVELPLQNADVDRRLGWHHGNGEWSGWHRSSAPSNESRILRLFAPQSPFHEMIITGPVAETLRSILMGGPSPGVFHAYTRHCNGSRVGLFCQESPAGKMIFDLTEGRDLNPTKEDEGIYFPGNADSAMSITLLKRLAWMLNSAPCYRSSESQ
jgi:hypothetical protein